ncbi:hypothetical protein RB195_010185 [Necator americanus]|uniref:Kinase domain protein n=1 Tax=Necator americanus TaxID=51031 RepID=A0ABR1D057_NECAM
MSSYENPQLIYYGIIGRGSFGRVELAFSNATKQYYAVKKLNIHEVVQEGHAEYVNREKQILCSLKNPFIVKLFGSHMDKVNLNLVMEYVEGGELRDYLYSMSEDELYDAVRFYSAEVIFALQHIHSKNVVYRDLKPENLLLSKDGHVRITDFGLAKVLKAKTYTICGTAEYMAPEIFQKSGYGTAVDWWSLGIVIFELISGKPPFCGNTVDETFEKIREGSLQYPDGFSCEAREVVTKLLDRNPQLRAPEVTALVWYSEIDWDNVKNATIKPPFVPASFDINDLQPLEEKADEVASMQRERDLFEDWCEF